MISSEFREVLEAVKPVLPKINITLPLIISFVSLGIYLIAIFYAEKK